MALVWVVLREARGQMKLFALAVVHHNGKSSGTLTKEVNLLIDRRSSSQSGLVSRPGMFSARLAHFGRVWSAWLETFLVALSLLRRRVRFLFLFFHFEFEFATREEERISHTWPL